MKIKNINISSLRIFLPCAFFLVSALAIIISGGISIYSTYRNNKESIVNEQRLIANEALDEVRSYINEKLTKITSVCRASNIADETKDNQNKVLGNLLGEDKSFRQIVYIDNNAVEQSRVSLLSSAEKGEITEDRVKKILASSHKEQYISSIIIDKITSEPLIIIATPIKDKLGDNKGAVLAEVNLKFIWELVEKIKVGNKGLAYIVDNKGNLIAYKEITKVIKGSNISHLDRVKEFINNDLSKQNDVRSSKGISGTNVVSTFTKLGKPDWAVVIEVPFSEAYSNVLENIKTSIIVIVLTIFLATLIGIYISGRITKPIIELRNVTKIVSEGDLNAVIEVKSKSEIGELANNFNEMLKNINLLVTNIKEVSKKIQLYSELLKEKSLSSLNSADYVAVAIGNINDGTKEQTHRSEEVSALSNQLGKKIDYVLESTKDVKVITNTTKDLSNKSKVTFDFLLEKANETFKITKVFSDESVKLNDSVKEIRKITDIVGRVSKKIKLLALNASIEAARIGKENRNISLIAKEMSNFANQTRDYTNSISIILGKIKDQSKITTDASIYAKEVVEEQMGAVSSVQHAFDDVISSMDSISSRIFTMDDSMDSVGELKDTSMSSIISIVTLIEQVSDYSEQIFDSSQNQKDLAQEVNKFSEELHSTGEKLTSAINRFKIVEN